MHITRSIDTQKGPADWFTGDVYIDAVAAPEATSTFAAARHTAIGGSIAPGGDHEPDDVAETLWRHHTQRTDFQVRLGID